MANQETKTLPGIITLFKQTLVFTKQHWLVLLKVVALAVLVSTLFQVSEVSPTYGSIWLLMVLNAYIWLVRHLFGEEDPTMGEAFYKGTGSLLSLILVFFIWSLLLLPAGVGAFIYGQVASPQFGANIVEQIGSGAIWLVLFGLSLYLLTRVLFAPLIATLPNMRPFQALSLSFNITKGYTNALFWRLAVTVFVVLAVLSLVTFGLFLLPGGQIVFELGLHIASVSFALPFLVIATFQLYLALT